MYNQKVSVIVPIYNLEMYIERCIKSILNQTHKNIELILINDGSQDNTLSICKKYEAIDNRVRVFSQENKGVSAARNIGMENATGKYITFIDGDDYVAENLVEKLLLPFEIEKELIFSTCRGKIVYDFDYAFEAAEPCEEFSTNVEFIKRYFMEVPYMQGACAKIYLADKLGNIRFREGKVFNEDGHFTYEYLRKNAGITYKTEERLYAYYTRAGSASHSAFSEKRLSTIEFSNSILEDCLHDTSLVEYAKFNYINRRFFIIKDIIRSKQYQQRKELLKVLRREIVVMKFPKVLNISKIKKLEYLFVKMGMPLYWIAIKIFDGLKLERKI